MSQPLEFVVGDPGVSLVGGDLVRCFALGLGSGLVSVPCLGSHGIRARKLGEDGAQARGRRRNESTRRAAVVAPLPPIYRRRWAEGTGVHGGGVAHDTLHDKNINCLTVKDPDK
jgi:hypothetical protein